MIFYSDVKIRSGETLIPVHLIYYEHTAGLSDQAKRKHPARDTLLRRLLFHFKHQLRKRRTADDAGQFVAVSDK